MDENPQEKSHEHPRQYSQDEDVIVIDSCEEDENEPESSYTGRDLNYRYPNISPSSSDDRHWLNGSNIEIVRDSTTGLCQLSRRPRSEGQHGAKYIQFHDFPKEKEFPLSLDSSEDVILHFIRGMNTQELLNEVGYRFRTKGKSEFQVPFLNNAMKIRRKYSCVGIRHCKKSSAEFMSHRHRNVNDVREWFKKMKEPKKLPQCSEVVMERAVNVYQTLQKLSSQGYCKFIGKVAEGADPILGGRKCTGMPVIRQNKTTQKRFIGCSGISWNFSAPVEGCKKSEKRHMSMELKDFTEKGIDALQEMLTTGRVPNLRQSCNYISPKSRRGATRCAKCFSSLSDSGSCNFELFEFENHGDNRDAGLPTNAELLRTEDEKSGNQEKITFAVAFGEHDHPPPPVPPVTIQKRRVLAAEVVKSPDAKPVVIKIRAQGELIGGGVLDGSQAVIGREAAYRMGRSARENKQSKYQQVNGIFRMVADPTEPYVRDTRTIDDGFVILLASDAMLLHAASSSFFSGDATYKSVTAERRDPLDKEWYLYNIVTRQNNQIFEGAGTTTVVVGRFLISRLTTEGYRAGWPMFLDHMRLTYAKFFESEERSHKDRLRKCRIKVPNIPMGSEFDSTAIDIRGITTDFEAVEVQGIALAFEDATGAPKDLYVQSLMVGCDVHFDLDMKCRTSKVGTVISEQLRNAMYKLSHANSIEDADTWLAAINEIDPQWVTWVRRKGIKCMIAPIWSKMEPATKALCFHNTNAVESQNSVVNNICSIGMVPGIAVKKLKELDTVRLNEMGSGSWKRRQTRPSRNYGGYTKKSGNGCKRRPLQHPKSHKAAKRPNTGRRKSDRNVLIDVTRKLAEALVTIDGNNGRRKILTTICLDIEDASNSEHIRLEVIRQKVLRVMMENENDDVIWGILSSIYSEVFSTDATEEGTPKLVATTVVTEGDKSGCHSEGKRPNDDNENNEAHHESIICLE